MSINDREKNMPEQALNNETVLDSSLDNLLNELSVLPTVESDETSLNLEEVLAEFGSGKKSELYDAIKITPAGATEENKEKTQAEEKKTFDEDGDIKIHKRKNKIKPSMPKIHTPVKKEKELQPQPEKEEKKRGFLDDTIPRMRKKEDNHEIDESGFTHGFRIKKKESEVEYELPGEYIKRENKYVKSQRTRTVLLFLMCLPICYLMLANQMKWPLPSFLSYIEHSFRVVAIMAGVQCVALALSYEIIAQGVRDFVKLKPNTESVILFSNIATLAHAGISLFNGGVYGPQPYCAVSCVLLMFAMYGTYLKNNAFIRACKTAGATKEPVGIFAKDLYGDKNIFKHRIEDKETFVGHLTSQDGTSRFFSYYSSIAIVVSIVFATVAAFNNRDINSFVWGLAAISTLSTPLFTLMSYGHPLSIISKKLSDIGGAIAGWYAVSQLNGNLKVILRDTDIFPHGCIKIHGLKVLGDYSLEQTLSYTTSIVKESRSGLYKVFSELLKSQFGRTEKVTSLKYYEAGGVEGIINGDKVLFGTSGFMMRMGIQIPSASNVKNAMFIAINSSVAGVYNITYKVNSEVQNGFDSMKRSKIQLVLATLDFNLTPMMIESEFALVGERYSRRRRRRKKSSAGGYMEYGESDLVYPEIEKRVDLSSDEQTIERDPCAVVSRAGFAPMAFSILAARRLRKSAVRNTVLSVIGSVIGMLIMFYLVFGVSVYAAAPQNVLAYMLLWSVPQYVLSKRAGNF